MIDATVSGRATGRDIRRGHHVGRWYSAQANLMRNDRLAAMAQRRNHAGDLGRLLAALDRRRRRRDIRGNSRRAGGVSETGSQAWEKIFDLRVEIPRPLAELRRLVTMSRGIIRDDGETTLRGKIDSALISYRKATTSPTRPPTAATYWVGVPSRPGTGG